MDTGVHLVSQIDKNKDMGHTKINSKKIQSNKTVQKGKFQPFTDK